MNDNEKLKQTTAIAFIKALSDEKIPLEVCDVNKNIDKDNIILKNKSNLKKKNTSSGAETIFNILVNKALSLELPITMKISTYTKKDISGMKYEARVYKYITEEILEKGYSPNFIAYVGSAECAFKTLLKFVNGGSRQKIMDTVNLDKAGKKKTNFLLTETAGNGAYFGLKETYPSKLFREIYYDLSDIDKKKVIFQIVNALEIMRRKNITHYDLHTGNILIATFPNSIDLTYNVDGVLFKISTRYIAYIFDWDFAYVEELGNNRKLDGYENLNFFNKTNTKTDLYTFFCTLTDGGEYKDFVGNQIFKSPFDIKKQKNERSSYKSSYDNLATLKKDSIFGEFDVLDHSNRDFDEHADYKVVYRVSGEKFKKLTTLEYLDENGYEVKEYPNDVSDLEEVFFYLDPPDVSSEEPILYIYNPYNCRMTGNSKLPTPKEILYMDIFEDFRTDSNGDNKFLYTMPKHI